MESTVDEASLSAGGLVCGDAGVGSEVHGFAPCCVHAVTLVVYLAAGADAGLLRLHFAVARSWLAMTVLSTGPQVITKRTPLATDLRPSLLDRHTGHATPG